MLNGISWGGYALIVTLALTAYYAAIGLWFYVQSFKVPNLGTGIAMKMQNARNSKKENIPQTTFAETADEDFQKIEALMGTLKDAIAEVFYHRQGRKVLLENLSRILRKHQEFRGTPFQEGIGQFIISECNKYGPVNLSADELKGMWSVEA